MPACRNSAWYAVRRLLEACRDVGNGGGRMVAMYGGLVDGRVDGRNWPSRVKCRAVAMNSGVNIEKVKWPLTKSIFIKSVAFWVAQSSVLRISL